MSSCQELIDRAVDSRAWYRKRATARTENRHSNDTPLQIDERTAFGRGTECQIKADEPIDGATANAVPSPARESYDAERGERRAIVVSHRDDDMTSAQSGLGCRCYWKSVRLETKHSDISSGVAARERSVCDAPAGQRELDVVVAIQDFSGIDDNCGARMDAGRGPPRSNLSSNDGAGGAFDELRGMIRACEKGTARFDHDYFSK